MMVQVAAIVFAVLVLGAAAFQVAVAAGAPWGHLTMGGRYEGRLPNPMRAAAGVQAVLLAGLSAAVLTRAEVIIESPPFWAGPVTWVAAAVSALSLILNLATSSKWERILWAPVAFGMLASSLVVALGSS